MRLSRKYVFQPGWHKMLSSIQPFDFNFGIGFQYIPSIVRTSGIEKLSLVLFKKN